MGKKILKIGIRVGVGIIALMLIISALLIVFKDNIKDYALEEINKHLNKRVHIGYIDIGIWKTFPNMSLEFDNVLIHSRFDELQTTDTALFAKKLRLRFSPLDFFDGNYTVKRIDLEDGLFNMKILEDGAVNYDFIKPSESDEPTNFEFSLEEIHVKNTVYSYVNKSTEQDYKTHLESMVLDGHFTEQEFTLNASLDFLVDHVKNKSLSLLSDKKAKCDIAISVDQLNNVFEIISADLTINSLPFLINGKVTADSLDFHIASHQLDLKEFATNFTMQELNVVNDLNGAGDVDIDVHIRGELETTRAPAIDADFKILHGSLKGQDFAANNIQAVGHYSNGIATGQEKLTVSKLSFNSAGSDFSGKITVTDFDHPRLKGDARGWLNLAMIHRLFGPFGMSSLTGAINLNGQFDLRLNDPKFDPKNITIYDLRTNLAMKDITAKFIGDERLLSVKQGDLVIRNQQAVFKNVGVQLEQSDITIDGTFNRIADYFMQKNSLLVDASLESNFLDVNDLSSNSTTPAKQSWLLPNDIQGKVNLDLTKVVYGGHTYSELQTRMNFDRRALDFPSLKGVNAGAHIAGSLRIEEPRPSVLIVKTNFQSNDIRFDRLFKEWNNFDQEVITADNIKGLATIRLNFEGGFNLYTDEVYKDDFKAKINITIKDGALVNVATFKEITGSLRETSARLLLSKERINDFEKELLNLKFATFENELTIEKGVLYIPRMEINSNALDVKLAGKHSFDNEIDYSFDFRFRELKGQQKASEFGDVVDDGTGFRIYLRMYGDLYDPSFAWDKDAQKKDRQERREEAKDELKSVLKSGLGINKKDTTIQDLQQTKQPKEKLIIDFKNDTIPDEFDPDQKEKRKTKLQLKMEQWKKENEQESEEFIID